MAFQSSSMPQPRLNRSGFKRFEEEVPEMEPLEVEAPRTSRHIELSYDNRIKERDYADKQKEKASKERDNELVMRAVYGNVGDQGEGQFKEKLSQELRDPMGPETQGEATFRADPYAADRMKKEATTIVRPPKAPSASATADHTDQLIDYANSFKPGMEIQTGKDAQGKPIMEPVTIEAVMRAAKKRSLKYNPNDPRWEELRKRWETATPPPADKETQAPGFMDKVKNISRSAKEKMLGAFGDEPASEGEDNPYAEEYPDAFQEEGQWKVVVDGKKYILNNE